MSEMITSTQLRAAADLIEDPERWTVSPWARDAHGSVVAPTSSDAVRWSAWGAVVRCADVIDIMSALDVIEALSALDAERPALAGVNDLGGHDAAVAELRRLADLADAREGTVTA